MNEPTKPPHPLTTVAGLAGAALGWAFSQYTGASSWIPLGAGLVWLLIFAKTPLKPAWFKGAIIFTLAQVSWFSIGGALTGTWQVVMWDVVVLSACVIALWVRPGLITACVLGLVEAVSLGVNVYAISDASFGDPVHRALTAHIVFRVLVLGALILEYRKLRKGRVPSADAQESAPHLA